MPDQFVPAWAEEALAPKAMPAHDKAELAMLRAFYERWEALHAMANDKMHRSQKEELAQKVVEAAMVIRSIREPRVSILKAHHG